MGFIKLENLERFATGLSQKANEKFAEQTQVTKISETLTTKSGEIEKIKTTLNTKVDSSSITIATEADIDKIINNIF